MHKHVRTAPEFAHANDNPTQHRKQASDSGCAHHVCQPPFFLPAGPNTCGRAGELKAQVAWACLLAAAALVALNCAHSAQYNALHEADQQARQHPTHTLPPCPTHICSFSSSALIASSSMSSGMRVYPGMWPSTNLRAGRAQEEQSWRSDLTGKEAGLIFCAQFLFAGSGMWLFNSPGKV